MNLFETTFDKLKEVLCKRDNAKDIVFFINSDIVTTDKMHKRLMEFRQLSDRSKALSYIPISYKKVVFCQNADGSWSDTVLKFLASHKKEELIKT